MAQQISALLYTMFGKATVTGSFVVGTTSLTLQTNHGARLGSTPFRAILYNSTDYADPADAYWNGQAEVIECTVRSTDTLSTIERGVDGTTAIASTAGKTYKLVLAPTSSFFSGVLGGVLTTTATGTTAIAIGNANVVILNNATALTVTDFTGSYHYKVIHVIRTGAGAATIQSNGSLVTRSGADRILAASEVASFTNHAGVWRESTSAPVIYGTGTPASVVVANIGTIYLRTDGGTTTTLYVKEADNGASTGWVAK